MYSVQENPQNRDVQKLQPIRHKCAIEWNRFSPLRLRAPFGVLHDNWEQDYSWPAHRWSALVVKWQTWGRL